MRTRIALSSFAAVNRTVSAFLGSVLLISAEIADVSRLQHFVVAKLLGRPMRSRTLEDDNDDGEDYDDNDD